ncbi:MAG: NADAR family protein [Sinobacterium sp.]|nr:NADAR family protein [Sinobacterium sp.]
MPLFPDIDPNAIFLSRTDEEYCLSSFAAYPFYLDEKEWPTIEHYFQANKFEDKAYQEKVRLAPSPKKARQLGRARLAKRKIRKDWSSVKVTIMTRAVYTCAKTHEAIRHELVESGELPFFESNNYDYFWGCGRDRRGENHYGKVLMQVRKKLQEETSNG